jgi:hypothetical protein
MKFMDNRALIAAPYQMSSYVKVTLLGFTPVRANISGVSFSVIDVAATATQP